MFPLPQQRPLPHGTSLTPRQELQGGGEEWDAPTRYDAQGAKKAQFPHPGPLVCHTPFFGIHTKMQTHLRQRVLPMAGEQRGVGSERVINRNGGSSGWERFGSMFVPPTQVWVP